jgi:small subunit ribosomal protein S1
MSNEVTQTAEEKVPETAVVEEQVSEQAFMEQPVQGIPVEVETPASASESVEEPAQAEMDFGAILEKFDREQSAFSAGELVHGKVEGITEQGVIINFGYKSEGVAPIADFTSPDGTIAVSVGDEVDVVVRSLPTGDASPQLSRADAIRRESWTEIETAFAAGTPIKGIVVDKTKGGLKVDIKGVEAFLPGSQIDSRPVRNLDVFKGQEIEAKVIKCSRKRNNIVLSRKVLTDEVYEKVKTETFDRIGLDYVIDGTIKSITEYGAFVDIGGIDGLLHVTDISWGRLNSPKEAFKPGDHVQVKVLKLDREKGKISLGVKQLLPDPWATVAEFYPVGSTVKGKVSSVTDYGAFVELEPGVEGLIHVSEMSWSKRAKHPKNLVNVGDEIEAQVLRVEPRDRRISLGMKQLQPNPWDTIYERFQPGSRIHGTIRNLTDFGAFVEVEDGVDGLVHVSDISWSKKIKHPKDVLKKGQEVDAVITKIDLDGHRLSLSIKDLTPSAWDNFVSSHRPGDVVRGKISRFAGFGVFVELAEDLEGLCHISELSDERVEKPDSIVSIGQELDFKILRIEADTQKIGLSARAVGKPTETHVDSKVYSTEAKGGMASLGELANLRRGRETEEAEAKAPEKSDVASEKFDSAAAATAVEVEVESAPAQPEVFEEKGIEIADVSVEISGAEAGSPQENS